MKSVKLSTILVVCIALCFGVCACTPSNSKLITEKNGQQFLICSGNSRIFDVNAGDNHEVIYYPSSQNTILTYSIINEVQKEELEKEYVFEKCVGGHASVCVLENHLLYLADIVSEDGQEKYWMFMDIPSEVPIYLERMENGYYDTDLGDLEIKQR